MMLHSPLPIPFLDEQSLFDMIRHDH